MNIVAPARLAPYHFNNYSVFDFDVQESPA
jgi:hypothetical protein